MIIPSHIQRVMNESDKLGGPTSAKEASDLVRRWLAGDMRAWEEFSVRNSKMVTACVQKWLVGGYDGGYGSFDDLWQEGMAGLLHAMSRIDASKIDGNPTSYCYPFILANIRRFSAKHLSRGMGNSGLFLKAWANGDKETALLLFRNMVHLEIQDHDAYRLREALSQHNTEDYADPAVMFDLMDRLDDAMLSMTSSDHEEMVALIGMRYGLWGGEPHTYNQMASVLGVSQHKVKTMLEEAMVTLARHFL